MEQKKDKQEIELPRACVCVWIGTLHGEMERPPYGILPGRPWLRNAQQVAHDRAGCHKGMEYYDRK